MSNSKKEKKILFIDKIKAIQKPKEEFFKPENNSLDNKKDCSVLKNITLSNSEYKSNDNNFIESNNFILNKNAKNSRDKNEIIISPFIQYFLCNEKYIKENIQNGNNYKNKSKNYILKNNFNNFDKIKIEDIDINKVNDILKNIDYLQNNKISEKNNFNFINNECLNYNISTCNLSKYYYIDDNLLNSSINTSKFYSKTFY